MGAEEDDPTDWAAPGPGEWALDRSHYPGGTTPISDWIISTAMPAGLGRFFEESGAPVRAVDARFVHGFMYTRRRPLVRPDSPSSTLPPEVVLKVLSHAHPEFRRRARAARRALEERPALAVLDDWEQRWRPQLVDLNLAFQSVDLDEFDDGDLDEYVGLLLDHAVGGAELHFWLHGHDLGPIAQFLTQCEEWGLDAAAAVDALAGASPSTSRPAERLVRIRRAIDAAGATPTTIEEVRAVSAEAASLVDEHLRFHGRVLATGYDLTAATLDELPGVLLDSILNAEPPRHADATSAAAALRDQVPVDRRADFDQSLGDARAVMDMRDDNGPLTVEWPVGLLRHALLEAGRRLVARGRWPDAELAIEVTPDEARALMASGGAPGVDELTARRDRRRADATRTPPATLGGPEPTPSPDVLPDPLPEMVRMIETAFRHLGMDAAAGSDGLSGVGVGSSHHTGVARVVDSAVEAMDALDPGDVLVVRATSPAFNVVLAMAGAVVTADGGAMSHAAVLARELGIPAVVGAADALSIPNGATVDVDAAAGRVTVRH